MLITNSIMDDTRIALIDRIVATRGELNYDRALYCSLFYAFSKCQNMSPDAARQLYPWLVDPVIHSYRLDADVALDLTVRILECVQVELLDQMAEIIEEEAFGEY